MSKAVLISIRPKWCELIASGHKTIEIRKTRPQIKTPFKCYIYCTKDNKTQFWIAKSYFYLDDHAHNAFDKCGNGVVIGEFICDRITDIHLTDEGYDFDVPKMTGLKYEEMEAYLGRKNGYGWHISALKIYDTPRKLSEFRSYNTLIDFEQGYPMPTHAISRPPQSYMYVEKLTT